MRFLDHPLTLEKFNVCSPVCDRQDVRKFTIVKRDHYYAVQYGQDVDIGVLDANATKALQSLDEVGSVTYEAVADASDFDQRVRTWKNKGKLADWNLEINIYGHREAREKVSKLLSAARLYLQQPRCLAGGLSVENPHIITFPNLTTQSQSGQLPIALQIPECSLATSTRDLTEVLEDLDQDDYLGLVDVDYRITSTLLKYARHRISLNAQY